MGVGSTQLFGQQMDLMAEMCYMDEQGVLVNECLDPVDMDGILDRLDLNGMISRCA
jgi:hypothetical protein